MIAPVFRVRLCVFVGVRGHIVSDLAFWGKILGVCLPGVADLAGMVCVGVFGVCKCRNGVLRLVISLRMVWRNQRGGSEGETENCYPTLNDTAVSRLRLSQSVWLDVG